jgi:hypothetical protein
LLKTGGAALTLGAALTVPAGSGALALSTAAGALAALAAPDALGAEPTCPASPGGALARSTITAIPPATSPIATAPIHAPRRLARESGPAPIAAARGRVGTRSVTAFRGSIAAPSRTLAASIVPLGATPGSIGATYTRAASAPTHAGSGASRGSS